MTDEQKNELFTDVFEMLDIYKEYSPLQADGTFFSNWSTALTLPDNLPDNDYLTLGWDMQTEYAIYDFNSTFEFQE